MCQSTNGWDRLPIRPARPAWNLPAWIGNHVNWEGEEKKDEREYYSHFVAMWREQKSEVLEMPTPQAMIVWMV